MLKLNVKMTGLDKGQKMTKDKAKRILMLCMMKMEEIAIKNAPVDKGFLRLNISLFPQILSYSYILTSNADYSADLEYGNTPKNVNLGDILAWVERKGIASGDGAENVAWYVAKKIREEGVNAHPFMRPALMQVINFWYDFYSKQVFFK